MHLSLPRPSIPKDTGPEQRKLRTQAVTLNQRNVKRRLQSNWKYLKFLQANILSLWFNYFKNIISTFIQKSILKAWSDGPHRWLQASAGMASGSVHPRGCLLIHSPRLCQQLKLLLPFNRGLRQCLKLSPAFHNMVSKWPQPFPFPSFIIASIITAHMCVLHTSHVCTSHLTCVYCIPHACMLYTSHVCTAYLTCVLYTSYVPTAHLTCMYYILHTCAIYLTCILHNSHVCTAHFACVYGTLPWRFIGSLDCHLVSRNHCSFSPPGQCSQAEIRCIPFLAP